MMPGKHLNRNAWLVIAAFAFVVTIISFSPPAVEKIENSSSIHASATPHPEISIDGDAELETFPNKTGSGTEADPYMISNLLINGSHPTIEVRNINAHLIIDGCILDGGGIEFDYMGALTIQDTLVTEVYVGYSYTIDGRDSENVKIINCTITNCNEGISIYQGNALIKDNVISNIYDEYGRGISVGGGYFTIMGNYIDNCYWSGINPSSGGAGCVLNNHVSNCQNYGIYVWGQYTLYNNTIENCTTPMYDFLTWWGSDAKYYGNTIDGVTSWVFFDFFIYNKNILFLTIMSLLCLGILFPLYKKSKINKNQLVKITFSFLLVALVFSLPFSIHSFFLITGGIFETPEDFFRFPFEFNGPVAYTNIVGLPGIILILIINWNRNYKRKPRQLIAKRN
ncbi:MAG: right-handed parallel beta-helix repeat-containing protein [Candidatus Hodarchaeota archaeon]